MPLSLAFKQLGSMIHTNQKIEEVLPPFRLQVSQRLKNSLSGTQSLFNFTGKPHEYELKTWLSNVQFRKQEESFAE